MNNYLNEVWKEIEGYEGLYMVSNYGRVKSLKYRRTSSSNILKGQVNCRNGYRYVMLYNPKPKAKRVHILVAKAFIENPLQKEYVNHRDADKVNNHVTNLEWITNRENITHRNKITKGKKKLTGAYFKKSWGRWHASIRVNGKLKHLGYTHSEQEAHDLYLQALKDYGLTNCYAQSA